MAAALNTTQFCQSCLAVGWIETSFGSCLISFYIQHHGLLMEAGENQLW